MKLQAYESSFKLTPEGIDRCVGRISETLSHAKIEQHSQVRLRLATEDVMLTWMDALGEEAECTFSVRKRLGIIQLALSAEGERADPTANKADSPSGAGSGANSILSMLGIAPVFSYENGRNVVQFRLKGKQLNPIVALLYAVFSGVAIGLLCRGLPAEMVNFITGDIVSPIFSAFMRCLSAISGPMMFLAVVWGIYNIGDIATFGRIGKRMVGRFVAVLFGVTALSLLMNAFFYTLNLGSATAGGESIFGKIFTMLLEIVPGNVLAPFSDGNALQIVFLAICIGLSMLLLSNKVKALADIVDQSNFVVDMLMSVIAKLVPVFIFCNILNIVLSGDISTLATSIKFLATYLGTMLALCVLFAFSVGLRYHVNPLNLVKKTSGTLFIAMTTASSSAAFSINMNDCTNNLGIDRKLANLGVPLGTVMFKIGNSVRSIILALFMANLYGVPVTANFLVGALLVSPILSIASPPIPGGSLTIFVILFSQLGIPYEAVGLATMINALLDFPLTASNLFCLQMELAVTAGKLGMLDTDKLRKA